MTPCMIERTGEAAEWPQSCFGQIGDCFQPGPLLSSDNQIRNLQETSRAFARLEPRLQTAKVCRVAAFALL